MSSNDKNAKSLLSQQTQRRCLGLLVENPRDFRVLYSPSRAHTFARLDDESEDGCSLGDSSDDEDDTMLLGRSAIRSSRSMMKSTITDNKNKTRELELLDSLVYSEDEGTTVQMSCLGQPSCGEGSVVFSNSKTLHSGTFVVEALNQAHRSSSSTSSSLESEESSFSGRQDHYFSPKGFSQVFSGENASGRTRTSTDNEEEQFRLVAAFNSRCSALEGKLNNDSFEGDFFIFSDDDGSAESRSRTSREQQQSRDTLLGNGALQDIPISDNPMEDESYKLFVASIQAAHKCRSSQRSTETKTPADHKNYSFENPVEFGYLAREQGRSTARRMVHREVQGSSPNRTEGTGETVSLSSDSGSSSFPQYAKSLLARVLWGRRWTRSPSPLDHVVEIVNHDVKGTEDDDGAHNFGIDSAHRVSDLALEALTGGSSTKRNMFADFTEWEAALSGDDDAKKEARINSTYSVNEENSDRQGNEEKSAFVIKAVSLLTQDFGESISRISPSTSQNLTPDLRDGLFEPRITTEDIATKLDMSEEGHQLLTHIRGRAGVIDNPEHLEEENGGRGQLPWVHLHDNIWMPHYEEYVVRSVHHFQQQLQRSMAAASAAGPSDRSSDYEKKNKQL